MKKSSHLGNIKMKKLSFGDYKNEKSSHLGTIKKKKERILCCINNEHNNEKQYLRKQKSPDYQN